VPNVAFLGRKSAQKYRQKTNAVPDSFANKLFFEDNIFVVNE
jgi:hypothetical protein